MEVVWYPGSVVGVGQACGMTNGPSGRKAVGSEQKQESEGTEPSPVRSGVPRKAGGL